MHHIEITVRIVNVDRYDSSDRTVKAELTTNTLVTNLTSSEVRAAMETAANGAVSQLARIDLDY